MNTKKYTKGGSLKPVPSEKKGLSKLPTEVRNKMGYMMGGGKMDMMYAKGGKLKKRGVIEDDKMRELISYGSIRPSQGVAKVDYESTLDVSNENGVSKTEYRSVGNISDDRGKAQRIVENSDGKTNTYYARKSNPTQPVKVGPSSPSKIMAGMNGRGYRDIEREVRPGISNSQSVSDLEKAKKMMYKKGGKLDKMYQNGGKTDPPRKLSPNALRLANAAPEPTMAARTEKAFMAKARAQEAINLNEMRNAIKSEGPESLARFDKELKAKGYKVVQKPVKKMMGGGKMEYAMGGMMKNKVKRLENREASLVARGSKAVDEGRERKADRLLGRAARVENRLIKAKESAPVKKMMAGGKMDVHDPKGLAHVGAKGAKKLSTPYNKTKDNNSYISNDVDMSPSIKKQMMALRQAMMYFTGVSPKNK